MLNIKDVVDLAKAGYSPKDVKELIELSKASEPEQSSAQPVLSETVSPFESTEPDKVSETPAKETGQPVAETDYKALYEAEKAKVNSLQQINNNKDVSAQNEYNMSELFDKVREFC